MTGPQEPVQTGFDELDDMANRHDAAGTPQPGAVADESATLSETELVADVATEPESPDSAEPGRADSAEPEAPPSADAPVVSDTFEPDMATEVPADEVDARERELAVERRMAHLHLRIGAYELARAELEMLAGLDALGPAGQADLAESCWRTGDLVAADDVVAGRLEAGDDLHGWPVMALVAAELRAALGRPNEARQLASVALQGLSLPLDAVFGGQPRSAAWPADPVSVDRGPDAIFADARPSAMRGGRIGLTAADEARAAVPPPPVPGRGGIVRRRGRPSSIAAAAGDPVTAGDRPAAGEEVGLVPDETSRPETAASDALEGLAIADGPVHVDDAATRWYQVDAFAPGGEPLVMGEPEPSAGGSAVHPDRPPSSPVPAVTRRTARAPDGPGELEAAALALESGDEHAAIVRLLVVLRIAPALAAAVLDLVRDRPGAEFELVRGDALRLVGRESAARDAFAAAVATIDERPADPGTLPAGPVDPPPAGTPRADADVATVPPSASLPDAGDPEGSGATAADRRVAPVADDPDSEPRPEFGEAGTPTD